MRAMLALLASLLVLAGLAWHFGWRLPAVWNPWAPLDVRQPPNLLTPYKLSRLRDDPALCRQALETSQLRYRAQADSPASANCPLRNVWRIEGGQARLSSSFLASCPLAVAMHCSKTMVCSPWRSGYWANPLRRSITWAASPAAMSITASRAA